MKLNWFTSSTAYHSDKIRTHRIGLRWTNSILHNLPTIWKYILPAENSQQNACACAVQCCRILHDPCANGGRSRRGRGREGSRNIQWGGPSGQCRKAHFNLPDKPDSLGKHFDDANGLFQVFDSFPLSLTGIVWICLLCEEEFQCGHHISSAASTKFDHWTQH